MQRRLLPLLIALLPACASYPGQPPTLESVTSRVDVARALECWRQPDARSKARCLGLEALDAVTGAALDEAGRLAEQALRELGGSGAGDVDEARLARDLDEAMHELNQAITSSR